uniref:Uncharacterized protein n=1 Tax=Candidatus Kentrum sp. TUN TaxID=2126343 RepID=A0A450ZMT5_9GAMM|nr:MAG: hypothetical protein BECKTUN1418D_GA0071000_102720 [Candidatus Kentron sp. TUN]
MTGNPDEMRIYELLRGDFKRIYSELVIATGSKPYQVIFELVDSFTHIAIAKTDPSVENENINASLKHVQRATLDASKLLWAHYKKELNNIASNDEIIRYCTSCHEDEFIKKCRYADKISLDARIVEEENVGMNSSASVNHYYNAAIAYRSAIDKIDQKKVKHFKIF